MPGAPRKRAAARCFQPRPLPGSSYTLITWERGIRPRAGALRREPPGDSGNVCKCEDWVCLSRPPLERGFFCCFFFFFTISGPPTSCASLRPRPAPAQMGRCLLLYEFKLGFAFEFRRSAAAARPSGDAGARVLDFGCRANSSKGSGCGGGSGGVPNDTRLSFAPGLLEEGGRTSSWMQTWSCRSAQLWRGWVTPGTARPAGCIKAGIGVLSRLRVARDAPVRSVPRLQHREPPSSPGQGGAGPAGRPLLAPRREPGGVLPGPGVGSLKPSLHPDRFFDSDGHFLFGISNLPALLRSVRNFQTQESLSGFPILERDFPWFSVFKAYLSDGDHVSLLCDTLPSSPHHTPPSPAVSPAPSRGAWWWATPTPTCSPHPACFGIAARFTQ